MLLADYVGLVEVGPDSVRKFREAEWSSRFREAVFGGPSNTMFRWFVAEWTRANALRGSAIGRGPDPDSARRAPG